MTKITKIEKQVTRSRYNIYLDGNYSFSVAENTLVKFSLVKEKNLGEKDISFIQEQEAVEKAMSRALRILSYRAHSTKELRMKLAKSTEENILDLVIERLIGAGYLDDERFALEYVELRKKGERVLRQELAQKGVSRDAVEAAFSGRGVEAEEDLFSNFYKKALQRYGGEPEQKQKTKIIRFLISKGFSYELISRGLKRK